MVKLLQHTRFPDVSFSRNGKIRITARVARALGISPGDALNIAVDGGEFLLYAIHIHDAGGFKYEAQCRPTNKGGRNYLAHSVRLCRTLLDLAGVNDLKASFMVGPPFERDGLTYVPIITRRPL